MNVKKIKGNKIKGKKLTATLLIAVFILSTLAIAIPTSLAQETISITGDVNAAVIRTDTLETVTFDIEITSEGPHYGVGIAFATSLDQPAFQVWYREYAEPYGWYYQEYDTGWTGEVTPIADMTGFSATGILTEQLFSVTIPTEELCEPGETYYYAIQVRTNLIEWYPEDSYDWGPDVTSLDPVDLFVLNEDTEIFYETIQSAIDEATIDDTVLVYPGTYDEDVTIGVNGLTLESTELHGANIKGTIEIGANGVTVDGFYITDFSQIPTPDWSGIYIPSGTGVKVVNNLIDGIAINPVACLSVGVHTLSGSTASATISNNEIMNVRMGIYIQAFNGGPFNITGNTIEDASHCAVGIDSGGTTLSPVLKGNAFINSGDMHLEYFGNHIVNATHNYWGTLNPYEPEAILISSLYGLGGVVNYSPWLGDLPGTDPMPLHYIVEPSEPGDPVDANATGDGSITVTDADTTVSYEDAEECIITVEDIEEDEAEKATFGAVGEYVDVKIDDPEAVGELLIKVYYDPTELGGLDESMLIMYWYDGTDWLPCSDTGVDTDNDYVWAKIRDDTSPSLAQMTGTLFGTGGSISLDATVYKAGDEITVTVVDSDANKDPIRIETVEVHTNSTIDIVGIDVELTETGVNTSKFTGSFLTTGEIPPPVGELAVNDANVVWVTYEFEEDKFVSVTAVIDDVAPEITVETLGTIIGQNVTTVIGTFDDLNIDTIYVEGVKATIAGNAFTALNVPLLYGNNTVTAVATDLCGLTNSSSTWIVSDTIGPAMTTDASAKPPKAIATGETYLSVNFTDVWSVMGSVLVNLTDIGGDEDQAMDYDATLGLWEYDATVEAPIDDGVYQLDITATDYLDNVNGEEYFLFEVVTDAVPPVIVSSTVDYPLGKFSAREGDDLIVTVVVTDEPAGVYSVVINGTEIKDAEAISMDGIDTDDDEYLATLNVGAGVSDGTYYLNVTAEDFAGNSAWTLVTVSILEAPQAYQVELYEGWNLFSLPLIPDVTSTEVVLADVMENVEIVWGYEDGAWLRYLPAVPEFSTLTDMEDGEGYWVKMKADDSLVVYGLELPKPPTLPPVYDVYEGWNLIGFKEVESMNITYYFATIPELVRASSVCYGWDATNQRYELAYLAGSPIDSAEFKPGQGYWLYLTDDAHIAPP